MCFMSTESSCQQTRSLPLESLPLLIDSLECKVSGLAPQLDGVEVAPLLRAHGLQDFQLDGQAVAVPARHVACPLAL